MKTIRSLITLVLLAVTIVCTVVGLRHVVKNKAINYIKHKYGKVVNMESSAIQEVSVGIFSRRFQVQASLDGVDFKIDLSEYSDTFVQEHTRRRYQDLIMEKYQNSDIIAIDIPYVDENCSSEKDLGRNDIEFFLEVYFDASVDADELLAARTLEIIKIIKNVGLTECNTLTTFVTIGETSTYLQIAPFGQEEYSTAELMRQMRSVPLEDG